MVYDALLPYNDEWRYNPKMLWTGVSDSRDSEKEELVFEVAELQQMTDPMMFIERTQDQYPGLDLEDVRQAFEEVKAEMLLLNEERLRVGELRSGMKEVKNRQKSTDPEQ